MLWARIGISWKRILASGHDIGMAMAGMLLALSARYGITGLPTDEQVITWVAVFALLSAISFRIFGLGRGMWRFASVTDLRAIVLAVSVSCVAFVIVMFLINRLDAFPRTVPLLAWFATIVLVGAPRLAYRALKDGGLTHLRPRDLEPDGVSHTIIIGSATQADQVIRTLGLELTRGFKVHGILDLKPRKQGRNVRGVPIIGVVDDIEEIVTHLSRRGVTLDSAVLACPDIDKSSLAKLMSSASRSRLRLRRVQPASIGSSELALRDLTLEDLLGRPPVRLQLEEIRSLITERVVVITGAGGSIGSEITRQVASHDPALIVMVENSEYALYEIDQTLAREYPEIRRRAVIGDVRSRERMRTLMLEERPSLVFHAAALKHVPMVEANVCEGVLTNVLGTRNVADAAIEADADAVVIISTDKAVRPTNIMGATKRAAEAYAQALDVSGARTRFITVRFGNVLGSTGSVIPHFKRQILSGGPVTVTHPEMRRYFMTIKEATELVMQAAAHGIDRADQRGRIFVLDMGEPVKIVELARTMIALAGLRPEEDIPIVFTGLRPGEKLFEELFDSEETTIPSGADGVFLATARHLALTAAAELVEELERDARAGDAVAARRRLSKLVPELPDSLLNETDLHSTQPPTIIPLRASQK